MKKLFRLLIISIISLVLALSLASCTKEVGSAEELHKATDGGGVELTNYSVSKYKGVKNNIEITSDFTIKTTDEYFTKMIDNYSRQDHVPGRMLEDSVINGNGHTITIKGESKGSLGRYSSGLFGRLINCEVYDLNIVYDLDLDLYTSNKSKGGLCGVADNCIIKNVNVIYKREAKFSGSTSGGLVGNFISGTVENCSVVGNFTLNTVSHFGSLLGGFGSGTVKNCSSECSVTAYNLHDCEVGGLFGWVSGDAYSNELKLSGFEVSGKTDKWTYYNAYCGGLAGKVYGTLHDCALELTEDAVVSSTEHSSGMFYTNMHTGVVAGWAAKGSKVNNIFVDASAGNSVNISFPNKALGVSLGISKNEAAEANKLYYVEDPIIQRHIERVDATESHIQDSYDKLYSFNMAGYDCSVRICFTQAENGSYQVTSLLVKIGNQTFTLTEKVDDYPLRPTFKAEIDGFRYEVTVSVEGLFVDFAKTMKMCTLDGVTFVNSYSDVKFSGEEGVIGGADNAWKISSDGKPQLKAFE